MGSIETWRTHQAQRINRIGIKISTPGVEWASRGGTLPAVLCCGAVHLEPWDSRGGGCPYPCVHLLWRTAVVLWMWALLISTTRSRHASAMSCTLIGWKGNLPEPSCFFFFLLKTLVICIMVSDCLVWDWRGIGRLISQSLRELGLGFGLILLPCTKSF